MGMCVGEKVRFETKKLKSEKKCLDLNKKNQILRMLVAQLLHLAAEDVLQIFMVALIVGNEEAKREVAVVMEREGTKEQTVVWIFSGKLVAEAVVVEEGGGSGDGERGDDGVDFLFGEEGGGDGE